MIKHGRVGQGAETTTVDTVAVTTSAVVMTAPPPPVPSTPTAAAAILPPSADLAAQPAPPVVEARQVGPSDSPPRLAAPAPPKHRPGAATEASGAHGQGTSPRCDPPYALDDHGYKHFKPECYATK